MVMASPSPQQVGREFVRQYYTVLHEAPDMLHRFYSSGSTFVHGGVDKPGQHIEEPVVGQLEIDKKIRALNFKDCHTKIRQVDSQSTIGSGVVVQVTGELSNNGEPMRRFMQTFVLAPQNPKKYYVHNDIFRYQDEVYQDVSDTESEEQTVSGNIEPASPTSLTDAVADQPEESVEQVVLTSVHEPEPIVEQHDEPPVDHHHHQQQSQLNGHLEPTTSSSEEPVEKASVEKAAPTHESSSSAEAKINSWAKIITNKGESGGAAQPTPAAAAPTVQSPRSKENRPPKQQQPQQPAPQQNAPSQQQQQQQQHHQNGNKQLGAAKPQRVAQPRNERPPAPAAVPVEIAAEPAQQPAVEGASAEEIERRFSRYIDEQQIFVGNLSPDLSDAELRAFFGQYGRVLEIRINTNQKQQSGRRLPNYGFVVFEDKLAVEKLLSSAKPNNLTYRNEKGEYRLNIEEKRARQGRASTTGYSGGGGGGGDRGGNRGNRGANRSDSNGSQQGQSGQQQQPYTGGKKSYYNQSANFEQTAEGVAAGGGASRRGPNPNKRSQN